MAVYRFKVCLEDNEDVVRDIDIKAAQTFEQFHTIIQEAYKFDAKHAASFFVSDDYWRKGQEITLNKEDLPLEEEEIRKGVDPKKLMADVRIAKYIEQPHQRFVYVFDPQVQWSFLIEMIKIVEESTKITYPSIVKSNGTPPKQYKAFNVVKEAPGEEAMLAALLADPEIEEEEIFKAIETGEEGIEDDDINSLEGEEGEEESVSEDGPEEDAAEDFGFNEEQEE
jgi:hypothetical protein